ncbi:MAG TPA: choline/ethanolamine kinase family protein [Streptosporangiaceae bacterium]|nr:choline/ethanolamine kinase family protein [Streptosporangiaceae bacterium]
MGNELKAPDQGIAAGDLDALFGRVPCLAGSPRSVKLLPGGLTNRNYRVTTPAGVFVARVFSPGSELLAIDRDNEYRNTQAAAVAGAGPPVIDYRPQDGLLVIGYIPGRTLRDADVAAERNLTRIAGACRRLHAGPPFVNDFDMFEIQRGYFEVVTSRGFRAPIGYADLMPRFEAVRRALAARPHRAVPCHNDLLAGNLVDDGERIWLIDYEYSGNNDPCFELGNIWSECALPADGLEDLVTAYYGQRLRNKIARARLLGLVAKYGWTLWGCIQAAASPLDHDFWSWGMRRYEGAAAGFTSREFTRLLDDVQRDD